MIKRKDIKIKIKKCSNSLFGLQDVGMNLINNNIFITNGFQCGLDQRGITFNIYNKINKDSIYKRHFSNNGFRYDISNNKWGDLFNLNISPRQCTNTITINNEIYIWGGYSYTPLTRKEIETLKNIPQKKNIMTYFDSLKITYENNKIQQYKTINLPYPLCASSVEKYKNKIFFLGGSIYINHGFYTNEIINNTFIGKKFFYMKYDYDKKEIDKEIIFLDNFPGTARMQSILINYKKYLYVIGGFNINEELDNSKGWLEFKKCNVIDNWKYDIENNKWTKLKELPFLLTGFGGVKYKEKYIVLIGGVKYDYTYHYSKGLEKTDDIKLNFYDFKLKYNGISNIKNNRKFSEKKYCCYNWYCSNLIIIYDMEKDEYILPSKKLDINIILPKLVNYKDNIYLVSGETNTTLLNDVYYGDHTSLTLKIEIDM